MKVHYLCEDLLELGILPHLPVKSLFRLQCVSRNWHSLISGNPHFIYLQSRLGPSSSTSGGFVCMNPHENREGASIALVSRDPTLVCIPPPFSPYVEGFCGRIVASCNGFLCVSYRHLDYKFRVSIGNPVLRDWIRLDLPDLLDSYADFPSFGLAVDTGESDVSFHLVALPNVGERNCNGACKFGFFVFSWRTHEWKMSKETIMFPSPFKVQHEAVYVNGSLYWISEPFNVSELIQSESASLLWFDPKLDRSGLHPLPAVADRKSGCMRIGEWGGKLTYALLTITGIQIWYLNDRSCWMKSHSISLSPEKVLPMIEPNEKTSEEERNEWWMTKFTGAQLMPFQGGNALSFCIADTVCSYNMATEEVTKQADTTWSWGWFAYKNSLVPMPKL